MSCWLYLMCFTSSPRSSSSVEPRWSGRVRAWLWVTMLKWWRTANRIWSLILRILMRALILQEFIWVSQDSLCFFWNHSCSLSDIWAGFLNDRAYSWDNSHSLPENSVVWYLCRVHWVLSYIWHRLLSNSSSFTTPSRRWRTASIESWTLHTTTPLVIRIVRFGDWISIRLAWPLASHALRCDCFDTSILAYTPSAILALASAVRLWSLSLDATRA